MKLEFNKLDLSNFRSFVGRHVFHFNDPGLHFMRGRNEAAPRLTANDVGKSTTFDALSWVLYGRTARGLQNTDVKPWDGKKSPSGVVHVAVDGKPHTIERGTDPNYTRVDGTDCTQDRINELLQLNYEIFSQTILLGQGKPLFFDLTPMKKMELFSEVLNLERWDNRAKSASEKVRGKEKTHAELTAELNSTTQTLDATIATFDTVKEKSNSWSSDQQKKLKSLRTELAGTADNLKNVTKIKDDAELAYESASVELRAVNNDKLAEEFRRISMDYTEAVADETQIVNDRKRTENELRTLGDVDKCPTCGQSLRGTGLDKHKRKLRDALDGLDGQIKAQGKVVDKRLVQLEKTKKRVDTAATTRKELQSKADAAESTVRIANVDHANYDAKCRSLSKQIADEENAENPYHDQVQQLRRRKGELTEREKELNTQLGKLETEINNTKYWVRGFKDIRLFVIEEVLHELELATNAMLPDVGLEGWDVRYDIEKETKSGTTQRGLNVTILSPRNDKPVKWEVWGGSVGERLRIVSALALSEVLLNYAGVNPDLEILDEPVHFSAMQGVRDLCEFLAGRADTLQKKVFFIDHRSIESTHFSTVTTIVKDRKGSYIDI
jgi:DNA repair exonuclease SbcCD ATPase subunit